jgi:hypothetical protein
MARCPPRIPPATDDGRCGPCADGVGNHAPGRATPAAPPSSQPRRARRPPSPHPHRHPSAPADPGPETFGRLGESTPTTGGSCSPRNPTGMWPVVCTAMAHCPPRIPAATGDGRWARCAAGAANHGPDHATRPAPASPVPSAPVARDVRRPGTLIATPLRPPIAAQKHFARSPKGHGCLAHSMVD